MAWIVLALDDCLVQGVVEDEQSQPVEGAIESCTQLVSEGHRLTVWTERFAPMPESEKNRLRDQIGEELHAWGFPPEMEIWTGTTKPCADIFIDPKGVTFDQDWGLALAQTQVMLEDRGLLPQQQMMQDAEVEEDPSLIQQEDPEQPQKEAPPPKKKPEGKKK